MNIIDLISKYNSKTALKWRESSYSYSYICDRVLTYKDFLIENEICSGSVVALIGDFTPNCIAMLIALIENNSITIPIAHEIKEYEQKEKLNLSEVEHIISFNKIDDKLSYECSNRLSNHYLYKLLRDINKPGLVLFSSGSSGTPKAAVHNISNLLEKITKNKTGYKTLNFLLFDHWGGLNTMFYTIFNGGVIVSVSNRSPMNIAKLINNNKVEILPVTPTFLNLFILSKAYEFFDVQCLRVISYGAEPMNESTLRATRRIFPTQKIVQTYGLIEVGVLSSRSDADDLWMELGGEGYDLRVVDDELQIKTKSTILGYLNAVSPITKDGWFKTGDHVLVEGKKYKIIGRKSEIINIGGEKVYPSEVENFIKKIDNIADVIVFGEKNLLIGNLLCANITLVNSDVDSHKIISVIKKSCLEKLDRHKVPIKIKVVDNLQISTRFKKLRKNI